jgi:hypothetical protein
MMRLNNFHEALVLNLEQELRMIKHRNYVCCMVIQRSHNSAHLLVAYDFTFNARSLSLKIKKSQLIYLGLKAYMRSEPSTGLHAIILLIFVPL